MSEEIPSAQLESRRGTPLFSMLGDSEDRVPIVSTQSLYRLRHHKPRIPRTIGSIAGIIGERDMWRVKVELGKVKRTADYKYTTYGVPFQTVFGKELERPRKLICMCDCVTGQLFEEKSGRCLSSHQIWLMPL